MTCRMRDADLDDFPVGTRVMTPLGRIGTVIRHKGWESKKDAFLRATVQYDGEGEMVTLQPRFLRKIPCAHARAVVLVNQLELF